MTTSAPLSPLATWAIAMVLGITLSGVPSLFGEIDDRGAEAAQAQDLEDAIKSEAANARFARAAATICGENAAWRLVDNDRTIICTTKRGHATRRVAL